MANASFIASGPSQNIGYWRPVFPQRSHSPFLGGGPSGPLKDYRWYLGQEARPSWYDYPEEKKKLRKAIAKAVKQKDAAQKKLEEPQKYDVVATVVQIQEIQDSLSRLTGLYAQMMAQLEADEAEEKELIDLLMSGEI